MQNFLTKISNIAKRKYKIEDFKINENKEQKKSKKDKLRLGFKPEKGAKQWSRSCQSSGKIKKQPMVFKADDINKILELGFFYDKDTKTYKKNLYDKKGNIIDVLVAINLPDDKNNDVYYVCDNIHNNDYKYIGFLSKSKNPNGLCMPCCYKKNQLLSRNTQINAYYNKCTGQQHETIIIDDIKKIKKIYILKHSTNYHPGNFMFLPDYIDSIINIYNDKKIELKNSYFFKSNSYFLKYCNEQNNKPLLSTICFILDITPEKFKNDIIKVVKNNNIFMFLNNGDIFVTFKTLDNYLNYIFNT